MHFARLGARRYGENDVSIDAASVRGDCLVCRGRSFADCCLCGAFSQENLGSGGGSNSRFADPDEQVNNFGRGAHPFGSNGPVVQLGAQQGQLAPFARYQGNGFNSPPPEPYSRPLGNGN
jgi:hypothetical protein